MALEPERTRRYRSVAALADDVRRYLAGEPIRAVPPSSWMLLRKLVGRNKLASGLVALTLGLVGTFGVVSGLMARSMAAQKADAEQARDEAQARAQRLAALLAFVPDCVHVTNRELSSYVLKPGTVLDESVDFSSANPHYDPHAARDLPQGEQAID